MKLGVDLSMVDELDELHPSLTYKGKEIEPFSFFSSYSGIKAVRLRLWHNPFDENGNPYGGGTNDINCLLRLAKRAKENGMSVLLDFHYSDFWVDPSRQKLPKAWEKLSFKEVIEALYQYTKETLIKLKEADIDLCGVQVGNEITNGMLHPFGEISKEYTEENGGGFKGFRMLLKAGFKAVKEIYPETKTVLHLEHSASIGLQKWFFDSLYAEGDIEFDVIGESYYPYWHGPLKDFKENITYLKETYHKEIWVVELGYEFAESKLEGHHSYFEMVGPEFEVGNIDGRIPFETTQKGQADYLKYFLKIAKDLGIEMVYYWEPTWVEVENNGWAKDPGQIYCGLEPVTAYNDWANETLFDYDGKGNEALEIFKQEYVDSIK